MKTLVLFAFALVTVLAQASFAMPGNGQIGCSQVCSGARAKIKADSKRVKGDYQRWVERLGVKGDLVRYSSGYSAAEEILYFMASYYPKKEDGSPINVSVLTHVMGRCFPEAYANSENARLSALVDTLWVARKTRVSNQILNCL